MILVGAHFCGACKHIAKQHSDVRYVEIPERIKDWSSPEGRAKKAVQRLRVSMYPVMLNDEMTKILFYPGPK